jgi:uncharacterized protein YukE
MQLNGAGGDGGHGNRGGGKWLQVTDGLLRGQAKKVGEVSTAFQKVDNAAMRETEQVPGSMKGFASDEAFKQFQELWRDQMRYLQKRYDSLAKALETSADHFRSTDAWTRQQVEKIERDKRGQSGKPTLNDLLNPQAPTYRPGDPDVIPTQPPLYPKKPLYGPYVPTSTPTLDVPES